MDPKQSNIEQSGPGGGGKLGPPNQHKYEVIKQKHKLKKKRKNKCFVFPMRGDFLKTRRAQRHVYGGIVQIGYKNVR